MSKKPLKRVEIYPHGIYLSPNKSLNTGNPSPGQRKIVKWLTDAVKRRISWVYMNGEWPSMLTLTFHSGIVVPYKQAKKALDNTLRLLRYRGVKYLWVLEFQRRGVPHFHVWMSRQFRDCPEKEDNYDNDSWRPIMRSWLKFSKQNDDKKAVSFGMHQRCYTHWKIMDKVNYAAKYAEKQQQKGLPVGVDFYGRWWGCSRDLEMQIDGYSISEKEYYTRSDFTEQDIKDFHQFRRQAVKLISKVQKVKNPEKFQYGLKRLISTKTMESSKKLLQYYITEKPQSDIPF